MQRGENLQCWLLGRDVNPVYLTAGRNPDSPSEEMDLMVSWVLTGNNLDIIQVLATTVRMCKK